MTDWEKRYKQATLDWAADRRRLLASQGQQLLVFGGFLGVLGFAIGAAVFRGPNRRAASDERF